MQKVDIELDTRSFPVFALDSHDRGLLVWEADLAFFVEACFLEVINESVIG